MNVTAFQMPPGNQPAGVDAVGNVEGMARKAVLYA